MNERSPVLYLCSLAGEKKSQLELCKTPKARVRAQEFQHVLAHELLHYALYAQAEQQPVCAEPGADAALRCLILTEERLCRLVSEMPSRTHSEETLLYTTQGKPYLKSVKTCRSVCSEGGRITFNLSHTDGAVICALGSRAIGADIERSADAPVQLRESLLRHCLTEKEQYYVYAAHTEEEQNFRFLRLWTLKESFAKACAKGLSLPFRSISFPLWETQTAAQETEQTEQTEQTERDLLNREIPFSLFSLEALWKEKEGGLPDEWAFWQGRYGSYVISVCMKKHPKD